MQQCVPQKLLHSRQHIFVCFNTFLHAYFYDHLAHALGRVGNRSIPYSCPLFWILFICFMVVEYWNFFPFPFPFNFRQKGIPGI